MNIKQIYDKIRDGDLISDEELDFALQYFEDLEEKLSNLGEVFHLPRMELTHMVLRLQGFKRSREREKLNNERKS